MTRSVRRRMGVLVAACVAGVGFVASAADPTSPLDRAAEKWVADTLKKMSLGDKVGQLLVPSINAVYTSADSEIYDRLMHLVRELHVGGFHVFGFSEPVPSVLLNPTYSSGRKGDPFAAVAMLNRLQRESDVPLLTTADFEGGVGYILNGGTRLPRAMAIAAARDPELAYRAGELSATEGRSLGVHVNFYPVADVNNNPRNPIINIRSFGEDVALVSEMARSYVRGIQAGGMLATAKHFPGHGDTAIDTHIALPVIDQPRERLDAVELPPFKAAIGEGVDAVMSSHIALPALDPAPGTPATLSRRILTGLLRDELGFGGLIFTDSMSMFAISQNFSPGAAAAMAIRAGADIVLHSPDEDAAFQGIKAAIESGTISEEEVTRSVERILRAKARLGLHRRVLPDLAAIDTRLGSRAGQRLAAEIAERSLTLLRDERHQVPLPAPRTGNLLYLSVIDYASGWREGAPSRAFIPQLRQRWPNVTAIEISDRATASELDMVRVLARRADAIVASAFVRIASYSGRMDLTPAQVALLESLSQGERPFVLVAFGNPYIASFLPKVPAVLLTYELCDASEVAAVRALAGEIPIGGKLPITLPGMFPLGHGLVRAAGSGQQAVGRMQLAVGRRQ